MTDSLKKLAEAAKASSYVAETGEVFYQPHPLAEFRRACTVEGVLNLIRERDEAREEVARYKRKLMQGEAVLAGWTRLDRIRLATGEMTAQEARTALAVANAIAASVRSSITAEPTTITKEPHHG